MKEFSLSKALEDPSGPFARQLLARAKGGRPRKIQDPEAITALRAMRDKGTRPKEMALLAGVSEATIYRYLNQYDDPPPPKCRVCKWLEAQEDSQDLISAVNQWIRKGSHQSELFNTLKSNGLPVGRATFDNHAHQCVKEQTHVASR